LIVSNAKGAKDAKEERNRERKEQSKKIKATTTCAGTTAAITEVTY